MRQEFIRPTSDDHRRFLVAFLFSGSLAPGPAECVSRAYRDFSRTASGITSGKGGVERKAQAHNIVRSLLDEALANNWTKKSFDAWHRNACDSIRRHYVVGGYPQFSVGQAQKWINMSIKYALSLIEAEIYRSSQKTNLWDVAHAPLDDFILEVTGAYREVPECRPWSRMTDYSLYMAVQDFMRKRFPKASSLDVEFHLYNEEAARRRGSGLPKTR